MRKYLFVDEAGDFDFSKKQNVSKYFVICTITCGSCDIGDKLIELRRDLAWAKKPLGEYFHACEDRQEIRDEVFKLISQDDFRIDATIMEKCKAQPQVRSSDSQFYQYGWYYHFKYLAPKILLQPDVEILATAASLGTNRLKATFKATVNDVMQQVARKNSWATYFCPAAADPCLQIVDYCAWAIQRKWERNDLRSYNLIRDKVSSEFDLFARGTKTYY